jgi:hypothetical protein
MRTQCAQCRAARSSAKKSYFLKKAKIAKQKSKDRKKQKDKKTKSSSRILRLENGLLKQEVAIFFKPT